MITLEKMLVLKTVPLFKFAPDELLLKVADVVTERMVERGECIIKQDEIGTAMYIIVKGKAKVHNGDYLIRVLEDREVFGELSALSLEKRTASVTAMSDTLLLQITHTDLYELMDLHIGLAKGIIHVLCQKAREIATQN